MERGINNRQIRCPRLGDETLLSYCLKESGDLPCLRIINCWYAHVDIVTFLKEELTPEKWDKFINFRPKDKVVSLIELIKAAKVIK